MRTRSAFSVLLLPLLILTACSDDGGQPFTTDEPRAFVSTLGSDTMSVEIFTRSGDVLEGTLVARTPATHVVDYSATLGTDGTIDRLEAVRSSFDRNGSARVDSRWSISMADTIATVFR
ncbi:MAG: hypothetical protein HKN17_07880, partial [Rhodothermales bacterium]|nr:hypothetical protein [Rhodothermales bacterium]